MYSNLALYYLNQMGITPWISKEKALKHQKKSDLSEIVSLKLVIFIPSELQPKTKLLLNRLIQFINLQDNELLIINMEQQGFAEDSMLWASSLDNKKTKAVLSLGLIPDILNHINAMDCPVLQCVSLDDLLNNPFSKKKIFHDLQYLKTILDTSASPIINGI